jgi:hypothetical protein
MRCAGDRSAALPGGAGADLPLVAVDDACRCPPVQVPWVASADVPMSPGPMIGGGLRLVSVWSVNTHPAPWSGCER